MTTELASYQTKVDWLGEQVITLADVWPEGDVRAMIVGLNPAPKSVQTGHYYQGQSGQRQLHRLVERGIVAAPAGTYFEDVSLAAGIGFTDLVKRPTPNEKGPTARELAYGRGLLTGLLADHDVPLVICVFRHPAEALLGSKTKLGYQDERTTWGARVFRLPGPYESRDVAASVMKSLRIQRSAP